MRTISECDYPMGQRKGKIIRCGMKATHIFIFKDNKSEMPMCSVHQQIAQFAAGVSHTECSIQEIVADFVEKG